MKKSCRSSRFFDVFGVFAGRFCLKYINVFDGMSEIAISVGGVRRSLFY